MLFCLPAAALLALAGGDTVTGRVVKVYDGDTFVLQNGQVVRLLDINTPEGPRDGKPAEAGADVARDALTAMVLDNNVRMVLGRRPLDRYGRLLAHVYLADGTWVNARLVEDGLAHVYTFADSAMEVDALLPLEDAAQAAGRGLWRHPAWRTRDAATCCGVAESGAFAKVRGRVASAGYGPKGTRYLNFGEDYRTDFTIKIDGRDKKRFKGLAWYEDWPAMRGRMVEVRGRLMPVNGMMVQATHPAQIRIVE